MKKLSWALLFVLFTSQVQAGKLIFTTGKEAKKVHKSLFYTFFPKGIVEAKLAQAKTEEEKKKYQKILKISSDMIGPLFKEVRKMEEIKLIHTLMANLDYLTSPLIAFAYYSFITKEKEEARKKLWTETKEIRKFIKKMKKDKKLIVLALYDLSLEEREKLFGMMMNNNLNYLRRIAFSTKLLYNSKIYHGEIAGLISGVQVEPHREDPEFFNPDYKFKGHHLKYNKKKKRIEGELDYIIVGSGVAGSVIANQLHKAGKKVLVLEKGNFIYPGAINARDDFRFLDAGGLRGDNDGSMFFLNGSVVGGGSTVNIDMSYPPTLPYIKLNIENWRKKGLIPKDLWTQSELKKAHDWVEDIFQIRKIKESEINANNHILLNGSKAMGMTLTEDQSDLKNGIQKYRLLTNAEGEVNMIDGKEIKVTDKKSVVERLLWNPMKNILNEDNGGKKTYPLVLEPNATVTRVLKKGLFKKTKTAVGVEFIKNKVWGHRGIIKDPTGMEIPVGKKVKVYAKNIILAAGNLGSTIILKNTKVKNKNVGRGFSAHPFLPIVGFFPEEVNAHLGTPSTIYLDQYLTKEPSNPQPGFLIESAAGNADLGGVIVPGKASQIYKAVENLKYVGGLGVILVEDTNPNNRIEVKNGKPVIYHHLSEKDRRRFAKGIAEGVRILFKAGAKKVSFISNENVFQRGKNHDFKFFEKESDANLVEMNMRFTENQSLIMGAHMLGANKLGVSPKNSVVDPNHQVWGMKNLFVVDASVFPTSPGANPMQTIYSIAKIFVDRHLKK